MPDRELYSPSKILYISLSDINMPSAYRKKKWTEDDDELMRSIARYGVLLPILLRQNGSKYDLVSGTRRFYACRRAGFHKIPSIIVDLTTYEGELMSFTENHNRKVMDFVEEAEALHRIISVHGISRDEAARRIGKSPSAVSNKLRLLNMPRELLYLARDSGLTERHVRALLRLSNSRTIASVMQEIIEKDLSVSETEQHIDEILHPKKENVIALGNAGIFMNTVYRGVGIMQKSGYDVDVVKEECETLIRLNITLSKKPSLC